MLEMRLHGLGAATLYAGTTSVVIAVDLGNDLGWKEAPRCRDSGRATSGGLEAREWRVKMFQFELSAFMELPS